MKISCAMICAARCRRAGARVASAPAALAGRCQLRAISSRCRSPFPISPATREARSGSTSRASCAPISNAPACSSRSIRNPLSTQISDINVPPNFANWRVINAQALVTGQVTHAARRPAAVDFRLWDVFGESQMLGLQYHHRRRKTGGASRIWSPTRSISASPARKAISTRASCSSRNRARAQPQEAAGDDGRGRRQSDLPHPTAIIWC